MKKTNILNNVLSTKARKAIASALALSMVLSGAVYATSGESKSDGRLATAAATTGEAVSTFVSGDINGDGEVTLEDAALALKGALKIQTNFTEKQIYAGDVDSNGTLDLNDAKLILQDALKIKPVPSKEPPVVTEPSVSVEPSAAPSKKPAVSRKPLPTGPVEASHTPRPSLEPVEAKQENVVSDYERVTIKKLNGAQVSGESIVFGPMPGDVTNEALTSVEGVRVENPFSGRTDLCEKPEDVIRTERINDKPTVWELSGASIEGTSGVDLKNVDIHVSNAEPQGHKFCDQETYDYTRPEWTKGISYSFWVNTQSEANGDPILTLENDNYIFSVKLNGSVRFLDANSTKERNSLELKSDQIVGGYGGWSHYTITIKNDWVQVYVNGQENVYTKVSMNRSVIQGFNNGFLTRYNPISVVTQEDVDKDIRHYYTGIDSTGHSAWYLNADTGKYEGHDDFSIFVNKRFMGAATSDPLLMDLLLNKNTRMWIGGVETAIEPENTARQFKMNTNVADFKAYDVELTPEQVAACYEYDTVTPEAITWDIAKAEINAGGDEAGDKLNIAEEGLGEWAEYDETTDIVTFLEPTGAATEVRGVELVNPFSDKKELRETLVEALSGQSIFPYLAVNGGTVEGASNLAMGCSSYGVEVMRGNFYDVYYGDPAVGGNFMNPPTGTMDNSSPVDSIMTLEELEAAYGNQKTEYQRPKWNNGLSVSFWAKPVDVDDSPLLTFYKSGNMLLVISVRGDVCFYSLDGTYNWYKQDVAPNLTPYNTFSALGDASYVKEGEWNYYTVTFANDWIQVYVNGQEMVYTEVNLNRGYNKYFNKGYLTRYNRVGHWTTEMIKELGDPTGETLEGTARNYLVKAGYLYDLTITDIWTNPQDGKLHSALSDKGFNSGMDSAAIRATGVYENPFNAVNKRCGLLIDYMTDKKVKMYLGGTPSVINLSSQYMFTDLQVTDEQVADEEFRKAVHCNDKTYYTEEKTDEEGNIVQVPTSQEQAISRCKYFFSDHLLDAGTQITGLSTYTEELSAQQIQDNYNKAEKPE